MRQRRRIQWALVAAILWSCGSVSADRPNADTLVEQTGVEGGLVVHLGCGDGRLTAGLRTDERYLVNGLGCDAASVEQAKRSVRQQGMSGPVSFHLFDGRHLPYIDNMVNLLVISRRFEVEREEVLRVLVPGGVAVTVDDDLAIVDRFDEKPWPSDIDQWTHSLHGADNNPVADDLRVGPPKHLQWICDPKWSKHHEVYPPTIPVIVSAAGRIFYFEDASPASVFNVQAHWSLVARDAFNGTLLWRRPMPSWEPGTWPGNLGGGLSGGPVDYRRRLVAVENRVYVTLDYRGPVVALDAATGQTLQTYEGTGGQATEIVHHDGVLFVSQTADQASNCQIVRIDPTSGRKQWESPGGSGMAVDGGRVLFIDRGRVAALNATTGEALWTASPLEGSVDRRGGKGRLRLQGPLRTGAGVVLACPGTRGAVIALSAEDGRRLWTYQNRAFRPFFRPVTALIIDDLVWVMDEGTPEGEVADDYLAVGLDPQSGEVRKRVPCGAVWNCGHHQRCYPSKATSQYMIFSRRGAEFLNLSDAAVGLNNWTRGACGYGVMPANGLLYAPPHSCRCYSEAALRGLHALAGEQSTVQSSESPVANRLKRGPAFDQALEAQFSTLDSSDWPTYRHDNARSGSTSIAVGDEMKAIWQCHFDGRITQPVTAAGTVYVAQVDAHTICAVDLDTGDRRWEFTAAGRIDTPPTVYQGRLLAGSADGWVYCLRADDGRLIWQFLAAPRHLQMGCNGQLESVWPVHGSVLVRDGVAYAAAGRGSFVDGGIWIYGLDVATGSVRYERHYEGPDTGAGFTRDNPGRGFVMPGALPDILVCDGDRVFMRHLAFDDELKTATDMQPNFYPAPVRAGEEFGGDHKYWCDLLEVGPRAFVGHPEWDHRSYFNNYPGQRLYSTTGLLDDSWHIRSYWSYGQVVGQYLVFRGNQGYAALAYPNAARWAKYQAGDGYVLYAADTRQPKPGERLYAADREQRRWQVELPLRPVAMVLAGDKLLVAGPPDAADPEEAAAALLGRRGGLLRTISTDDGATLAEYPLDSAPAFDGLIAASGRVLMATHDGKLICFE